MQIDIQARTFKLTEGLRSHATRRVRSALAAMAGRIQRIVVRLTDDNGPKGGIDKRCQIRASVAGTRPIVIEQHDADLYVAIDRAADRAGRTIAQRVSRAASRRRFVRSRLAEDPVLG